MDGGLLGIIGGLLVVIQGLILREVGYVRRAVDGNDARIDQMADRLARLEGRRVTRAR